MTDEARLRDYLARDKVGRSLHAAKKGPRHRARNCAVILLVYRHGLRASELVDFRVSALNLNAGTIYCRRAKRSRSILHPMKANEVAAVERQLRERKLRAFDYVFASERSGKDQ